MCQNYLGFVGEEDNIDTSVIDASLNAIPVIAPIGIGADECFYNINADLVAGSIAATSTDIIEIGRLIARESETVICTNCPGLVALAMVSDAKVKIYCPPSN
jgi:hypothetical protein